jgi:hypothetical protein
MAPMFGKLASTLITVVGEYLQNYMIGVNNEQEREVRTSSLNASHVTYWRSERSCRHAC